MPDVSSPQGGTSVAARRDAASVALAATSGQPVARAHPSFRKARARRPSRSAASALSTSERPASQVEAGRAKGAELGRGGGSWAWGGSMAGEHAETVVEVSSASASADKPDLASRDGDGLLRSSVAAALASANDRSFILSLSQGDSRDRSNRRRRCPHRAWRSWHLAWRRTPARNFSAAMPTPAACQRRGTGP